jgi:hypothetical protein
MYDGSFLLKHIVEEKIRMKTGRKELLYNGTVNWFLAPYNTNNVHT